ncbi:hypothetical protein BTN50_0556 [Candidatus Enterovibrio altilux]|uniref:Mobile element protein n=1 Tax=Candidatus Enterovibrio altilux TaxID=1927128 RepID=A0A291B7W4_9GAMM|nr:hypothetical protein BTN50_0556 [Candidatus Enterovibrio luxaltus]
MRAKTVNVTFKTKNKGTSQHLAINSTEIKICIKSFLLN